jgi:hypothetical protein
MPDEIKLPGYAKLGGKHRALQIVDVDADAAYRAWLDELGVTTIDRYWLEVAYQCIKMELQVAMRRFGFEIHIHDPEKHWAQAKVPNGKGADAASKGKEAREHFRRLRGFIPS